MFECIIIVTDKEYTFILQCESDYIFSTLDQTMLCLCFIDSLFICIAEPVSEWTTSLVDVTSTSFELQWEKLDTFITPGAKFYIVEVKCIQGTTLTVEIVPGNATTTVIKGLRPSTQYRVCVFGVNDLGQTYKGVEIVDTTNEGKRK